MTLLTTSVAKIDDTFNNNWRKNYPLKVFFSENIKISPKTRASQDDPPYTTVALV